MDLRVSRIYIRLTEFFFKCVKQDVNYSIAKHLIEHIDEFPDIYIEEIAYLANTTPASVTKFCKRIGYSSFKEMRTDTSLYADHGLLDSVTLNDDIDSAVDQFIHQDQMIQKKIFSLLNEEQCLRVAETLQPMKKIAILGNTYSFSSVNLFRELLSQQGYTVYEVNRRAAEDILTDSFDEVEGIIVISLTGEWVDKNQAFLTGIKKPAFLLTHVLRPNHCSLFNEIIEFAQYDFLLSSTYYSQKVVHSWIILLAILLKSISSDEQERKNNR